MQQLERKVTVSQLLEPLLNVPLCSTVTSVSFFPLFVQVLHCCVSGSNLHTQQSHYLLSLADLSTDYDPFLTLGQVKNSEPPPMHNSTGEFGNLLTVAEGKFGLSLMSQIQLCPQELWQVIVYTISFIFIITISAHLYDLFI